MKQLLWIIVVGALIALRWFFVQSISSPMDSFSLKSSAFKDGGAIPSRYTCEGDNINPLLEILKVPEGTKTLALIMDDPDAPRGAWVHWLVWNIEPKTQYISEDSIPFNAVQGANSSGHVKYDGPCPPKGDTPHRYFFKLYALDSTIDHTQGTQKLELENAMKEHILAETALVGTYQRK